MPKAVQLRLTPRGLELTRLGLHITLTISFLYLLLSRTFTQVVLKYGLIMA